MVGLAWDDRRIRLVVIAVAWLAAAVNLVRGFRFALAAPDRGQGDLHVYLEATRWLRAGSPLYDYATSTGLGFTYPPFAALVLAPWGFLSDPVAELLWTVGILAGVVCLGIVVGLRARPDWSPPVRWTVAGIVVAVSTQTVFVQANLATGQISLLLVCLSLVDCSRVFRSPRWGALSGFAAAIKLTPSLIVLLHLIADRRRARWSLGAAVVSTLAAAVVLPRESLTYWTSALWQTSRVGEVDYLGNLTWVGVVVRAGWDGTTGRVLGLVLGAATALAALWNGRRHWSENPVAAVAIVGCASVVAAPISWPHHAVWLVVWAFCLIVSRSVWLRTLGTGLLLLSLFWTPVAAVAAQWGAAAILSAVPVLAMSVAAALRIPSPRPTSVSVESLTGGAALG